MNLIANNTINGTSTTAGLTAQIKQLLVPITDYLGSFSCDRSLLFQR
jgi:hypothetical protein